MSHRFASSRENDMRPLAFQGMKAVDCYAHLRDLLRRNAAFLASRGLPNAERLLAEPMRDERTGVIDWYADTAEAPVPYSALPDDRKTEAAHAMDGVAAALSALLAEREAQSAQSGSDASTQVLKLAARHPSKDDIYFADGHPVLVNWGFRPGDDGAVPEDITRRGALIPPKPTPSSGPAPVTPPPPAPPAPPAPRAGCLGWLLPLLLLLLLLWLLLAALGLLPSPLPAGCMKDGEDTSRDEELRAAALDDEYARLLARLGERAALCRPSEPEEEPEEELEPVIPDLTPPEPTPKPEPEEAVAVPFFGDPPVVDEPKVEKPKVEKPKEQPKIEQPKEQPKVEPPRPTPKKNEDMKIPEDAAKTNDLSFLEGCWKSDTGLFNNHGEPIDAEYCFNRRGEGRRFVREPSGQRCSGKVTAKFKGSQLAIDGSSAPCPNGREYVPQKIECTGSESSTQCKGQELGGSGNRWNHRFRRK